MVARLPSNLALWIVQGALTLFLAVIGFMGSREFGRNDDQECRLRAVEQAVVEIQFIRGDVQDIKRMILKDASRTGER